MSIVYLRPNVVIINPATNHLKNKPVENKQKSTRIGKAIGGTFGCFILTTVVNNVIRSKIFPGAIDAFKFLVEKSKLNPNDVVKKILSSKKATIFLYILPHFILIGSMFANTFLCAKAGSLIQSKLQSSKK